MYSNKISHFNLISVVVGRLGIKGHKLSNSLYKTFSFILFSLSTFISLELFYVIKIIQNRNDSLNGK